MIFAKPIPFAEALAARAIKALLPTTATAAQLEQLAPAIKHRATFSARTAAASHLAEIDRVVNRIVGFAPEYDRDPQTGQVRRTTPGDYINETRARQILRQSLADIGYDPQDIDAAPGSLKDLASRQRIHVILDTNVRMARNYGTWKQGQDSAILDVWPCQELVRHQSRDERRDCHRPGRAVVDRTAGHRAARAIAAIMVWGCKGEGSGGCAGSGLCGVWRGV